MAATDETADLAIWNDDTRTLADLAACGVRIAPTWEETRWADTPLAELKERVLTKPAFGGSGGVCAAEPGALREGLAEVRLSGPLKSGSKRRVTFRRQRPGSWRGWAGRPSMPVSMG